MNPPPAQSTVAAVHTALAMVEPTKVLFSELLPDVRLINIVDDSLIQDVIRTGAVSDAVARRLKMYFHAAVDAGANLIFNTCSSVSEVALTARPEFPIPIVQIDESMAASAVRTADSIAVLATLPTTLGPTIRLVERAARKAGRSVRLLSGLAEGAYEALVGGEPEKHDLLILRTAIRIGKQADTLLLAQGSMARMESILARETGKPVLSSPRSGVLAVKTVLEANCRQTVPGRPSPLPTASPP